MTESEKRQRGNFDLAKNQQSLIRHVPATFHEAASYCLYAV